MDAYCETKNGLESERPPALGERAALGGYIPQYEVAADLLLRALTDETVEWLGLADPEAGRLDDFQLAIADQLDAYQIKWSEAGGQLPWSALRTYIAQLVVDRQSLARVHPERQVIAHLYTNQVASSSPIRNIQRSGPAASPATALAQLLQPATEGTFASTAAIPAGWLSVWNDIAKASGLSNEELLEQFLSIRIQLGRARPSQIDLPGRDTIAYRRDLDELMVALFRITTDPRRPVRVTRDQLLDRLGERWRGRLELASTHDFPTPVVYAPVASTADQLKLAVGRFTTGYVALIGSPGSGKSTLLTQELRGRTDVVARYYAYVRGRADVGSRRAEASSFLHDLVLTLERSGVPRGPTPVDYDIDHLTSRLERQLSQLGRRYSGGGARSIIVIDGLDHAERESAVDRPMLHYLPLPDALPDGVLIVVGSQTLRMLHADIRTQLERDGRTLEMAGLERPAVQKIAAAWGVVASVDQLWHVTSGHPLVLAYVLEELRDTPAEGHDARLQTMPPYGGDVETLYARLWSDVGEDAELVELLGLACRMRGPIDLAWLRERGELPAVIRRLRDRLAHLFRREPDRWFFFHESFRLFLQERTSRSAGAALDQRENQRFHRRLADMCRATPINEPVSWDLLFHLAGAENHSAVLSAAKPEFFRIQQLALRPPDLIQGDIRMAARSLERLQDGMALVRLVIAAGEVSQRTYHFPDREEFLRLLIMTGDGRIAVEHMDAERESFGEEDDRTARLRLSLALLDVGLGEEARQVFLNNEPLEVLEGRGDSRHFRALHQLVYAWARCAAVFRGWAAVNSAAAELRLPPDRQHPATGEEASSELARAWMLAAAADELDHRGNTDDSERLGSALDANVEVQRSPWLWLTARRCRRHADRLGDLVDQMTLRVQPTDLEGVDRVTVAEGLWKADRRAEAIRWIAGIEQPPLSNEPGMARDLWKSEEFRYRLGRLLSATGQRFHPDSLIQQPARDFDWGYVRVARITLTIAQLDGRTWTDDDLDATDVSIALDAVLRNLEFESTGDWSATYPLGQVRASALAQLLAVAGIYGREAVQIVWARYEQRWLETPALLLREGHGVLLAALETQFIAPAAVKERLRQLEGLVQASLSGGSAASDLTKLAETMLKAGLEDDSRRLVRQAVSATLSVHERKDYQLSSWIDLLGPRLDGENGERLAEWLAGTIVDLEEYTGGAQASHAAQRLLLADGSRRPGHSWRLGAWLEEQRVINWDDRAMTILEAQIAIAADPLWWSVLVDQVVPITPEPEVRLLSEGADQAVIGHDAIWLRGRLSSILARVEAEAPPHTRDQWRLAVADCAAAHNISFSELGLHDDMHPERRPPRSRSRGTDEQQRDAFLAAHATVEALLAGAGQADLSEWRSEWEEAVSINAPRMNLHEVERAAAIFSSGHSRLGIRVHLARRALQLGAPDVAASLANEVVKEAEARSWLRNWDRGWLMAAFRLLAQIDRSDATTRAYRRFAADAGTDIYLLPEVAHELEEFLDLFGIADRAALGAEVEQYLRVLLPNPGLIPPAEVGRAADDPGIALARIGIDLLCFPYRLAVTTAQRALAELVKTGDPRVQTLLAMLLRSDDEEMVLRALSVVEAAVGAGANIIDELASSVGRWTVAEHLGLRLSARRLGRRLGRNPERPQPKDLPPSYSLVVPQPPEPPGLEGGTPIGRNDLERTLAAFAHELRNLADRGGVDAGALNARVVSLARKLAGAKPVDDDRWKTDSSPLGWTFHKPSIGLWEQAAARAAGELADAGRLDPELALILSVGQGYDAALIATRPVPRPNAVRPLPEGDLTRMRPDEWIADLAEDRLAIEAEGGWTVIGESTELRRLDREMPWERRAQAIGVLAGLDRDWRAAGRLHTLVSDLENMPPPRDANPLVYEWDFTYRGPSAWLALHPRLADACGWSRDPDSLIGWRDEDGPVVRSVWWRSGWLDSARWVHRDEVGEGWIVVARPRALERLEQVLGGTLGIAWQLERGFLAKAHPGGKRSGVRRIAN